MENALQTRPVSKRRLNTSKIVQYAFMVLLCFFFLFPFFVMVTRSFMTDDEINFFPALLPSTLNLEPYLRIISNVKMMYWFGNTLIIALINVIGIPLSASLCAFGFSKLKFKGRDLWFSITLATIMLPSISMQIPLYSMYVDLNWIGTWNPMIVPCFFGGGAINIFLIRQFMKGIPDQLTESAKIDGANKLTIYFRIIIPLCFPIITYIMVMTFLGVWNDFMTPLMYLKTNERMFTISLGLYMQFKAALSNTNYANTQMAAGILMMIPCMALFFIFQRQLINGVTMSGIKG